MILGLDISTSITGYTVVDLEGNIVEIGHWNFTNKKKFPTLFSKACEIKNYLLRLGRPIEHIYIEAALSVFSMGKSSAKTISTLTKFNGIVSWICYEIFGIEPEYLGATSARKMCGITVKRGTPAKEQVMRFLLDKEMYIRVEYSQKGNLKKHCYDEADALVIALAGQKCLTEKLKL